MFVIEKMQPGRRKRQHNKCYKILRIKTHPRKSITKIINSK